MDVQPVDDTVDPGSRSAPDANRRFAGLSAALFALSVGLLLFGAATLDLYDLPPLARASPVVGDLLAGIALLATTWGLMARRAWAPLVAVVLLSLSVAVGIRGIVVAFASGSIFIPITAIAALLILLRRPPAIVTWPALRRDRLVVVGLSAVYVAALASAGVTSLLLAPGASPFSIASTALDLSVESGCNLATLPADPAQQLTVTVRWHWREQELLAGSTDGMIVTWSSDQEIASDDTSTRMPDWMWTGVGSPAAALIQPIEMAGSPSAEFGIDVEHAGLRDGEVTVGLSVYKASRPFTVMFRAAYAHLDRWLVRADPAKCEFAAG